MTKKNLALIGTAILLIAFFLYVNRDWFTRGRIQIYHRALPKMGAGRRRPGAAPAAPLLFGFDRRLALTSVKVVPVSDLETNSRPHPVWHLVTDSNSLPTEGFTYGMTVPGMKPAINGASAEALEPGIKYRLLIQAGSLTAQHDFTAQPATP